MKPILVAIAAIAALAVPMNARAADTSDVVPVTNLVAALNGHSAAQAQAQLAPTATIVDEFAPYTWSGAGAGTQFMASFVAELAQIKMTNVKLKAGNAVENVIKGDSAYVVVPVEVSADFVGLKYGESGAFAAAMQKINGKWKIQTVAWAKYAERGIPPTARIVPAPYATVTRAIDGLATNNMAQTLAQFSTNVTIVDEFAPFTWYGTDAVDRYDTAFAGEMKSLKATNVKAAPGDELSIFQNVEGKNAYMSIPVTLSFESNGKQMSEKGYFAYTLTQYNGTWKITGQYWSTTTKLSP